jgi:uncharacterized membrane protein YozB (DUF420 family)
MRAAVWIAAVAAPLAVLAILLARTLHQDRHRE